VLDSTVDAPGLTTEHEVRLAGLSPATRYYYAVGVHVVHLQGNDAYHYFTTSPNPGEPSATRVWALGDSGTANATAAAVRDAYYRFAGDTVTNVWLTVGDNAYRNGSDYEYQVALFDMYGVMLRKTFLWPALGNHDTAGSPTPPTGVPFHDIFTLPEPESYYSFDHANVHFICLDSNTPDLSPDGPMLSWLKRDLDVIRQDWIIAYWHYAPYTKGSHDSDTEERLIEVRRNVLPILDEGGVDLVLSGHSHSYERSFLIAGHYDLSSTFSAAMKRDAGDGRVGGDGPYLKPTSGPEPREGAVYVVAGSSGQISGGALNHPAMFISLNVPGSLVIDVNAARLDVRFLQQDGRVGDYFTMGKGPPPVAPTEAFASGVGRTVVISWRDNSRNEEGFVVERSTDGASFAAVATVGRSVSGYVDATAAAGGRHRYRVRAFNVVGNSSYSKETRPVITRE
jgi:hypothetical protein